MNKLMCLIGKNISHSLSPKLYNDYFKNNKIDIEYSLCDIHNLEDFIINKSKNYISFNVTYPYKTQIIKYLNNKEDFINESPNLIININKDTSNNTVFSKEKTKNQGNYHPGHFDNILNRSVNNKLIGFNTDGIGFYDSLIENGINPNNKNITIIGYGGAGKSINEYLSKNTNAKINILTHNDTNILFNENDKNKCKLNFLLNLLYNTDILINASSAGFNDIEETPIPLYIAKKIYENNKDLIYIDIIYKNKTKLLTFFENLNIKTLDGFPMLKGQFNNNIKILKENRFF